MYGCQTTISIIALTHFENFFLNCRVVMTLLEGASVVLVGKSVTHSAETVTRQLFCYIIISFFVIVYVMSFN